MPTYYGARTRNSFGRSRPRTNYQKTRKGPAKSTIHPSKFVKRATAESEPDYVPTNNFDDFQIHPMLKRNIAEKGFVTPSPIQDQAIPLALEGRDIIGVASTGTGKTAAFGIPIINRLIEDMGSAVLILAPTRELAGQIETDMRSMARGSGLFGVLLIGGVNISPQIRDLKNRPEVIIGTPGRVKDHLQRGTLKLDSVNKVVLDEVDRMLDMGFINDIRSILEQLPKERQSMFFSATLDGSISTLIQQFSDNPTTIQVNAARSSDNVHQDIVEYSTKSDQISKLHQLLLAEHVEKAIVFSETKRSVEKLTQELVARGLSADAIHGGKNQSQRKRALDKFKRDQVDILVATDVAARGIDVTGITHVVNYTQPQTYDDYIHRIGRAGRAGSIGHALTFVEK